MQYISKKEVDRLVNDPIGFAIMMDDSQIEDLIAAFVSVLNKRKNNNWWSK